MKTTIWLLAFTAGVAALAQVPESQADGLQSGPQRMFTLRGEISSPTPIAESWAVELIPDGHGITRRVLVNRDGSFEIHIADCGTYDLSVMDGGGKLVYRQPVFVSQPQQFLSIQLPHSTGMAARSAENSTSLHQLQHKIPAEAQTAFRQAQIAASKGNQQEAIELFRQAIAIDPEYADAYNDLGVLEAAQNQLREAAGQFQKAIGLEPDHRLAAANLSVVLAKMENFQEAGRVARKALELNPNDAQLHFILASSLLVTGGDTAEALTNLQQASREIPKAHLLAAAALAQAACRKGALEQLKEYQRAAPADDTNRSKVEAWITQLEQQVDP